MSSATILPKTKHIVLALDHGWLTIWLNRPEARNALSDELVAELRDVLAAVRDDRGVRGITLRGKGGNFSAGGDLKTFQGLCDMESVKTTSRRAGEVLMMISTMPQVTVALVEGAAMAGGLGIVATSDIVISTRDAKYALTEAMIGLSAAQIAPYLVERVGFSTARRLMITAARFDGAQAAELGFVDYVVDDSKGLESAEKSIRRDVLRCAPGAVSVNKDVVRASQRLDREAMMEFAATSFSECLLSEEGREGIASFIEKRKPSWALLEG